MSLRRLLVVFLVAAFSAISAAAAPVQIGILTDVHAHDTDSPIEHKVMTNYGPRIGAFVDAMVAWPADAVVELGDFVNGAFVMGMMPGDPARIAGLLDTAVAELARFPGPTHFVLGNHDVYSLSKAEFLEAVGAPSATSSFDLAGYHMVILDAEFTRAGADVAAVGWMVQGTIPRAQLDWLRGDLAATSLPTVIFVHQPLDVPFELEAGGPSVSNYLEVQTLLSQSGRVIAVFQGHSHENRHTVIDGIHYVTFAAMVDSDVPTPPSWAAVTLDPDTRTVRIDGAGLQEDLEFNY